MQNPNNEEVDIHVTYLTPTGQSNVTFTDSVPANSRKTYSMAEKLPSGRVAILVESLSITKRVMVERAMYWNSRGAGTDTVGGYSD